MMDECMPMLSCRRRRQARRILLAPYSRTIPAHLHIAVDDDTFRMRSKAIAPILPCEGHPVRITSRFA